MTSGTKVWNIIAGVASLIMGVVLLVYPEQGIVAIAIIAINIGLKKNNPIPKPVLCPNDLASLILYEIVNNINANCPITGIAPAHNKNT